MPASKTIRLIGHRTINAVWRIGMATRFFILTLLYSGTSFRRFHLIVKELFSTGVMSADHHRGGRFVRRDGAGPAGL